MKRFVYEVLFLILRQRPLIIRGVLLLVILYVLSVPFHGVLPRLLEGETSALAIVERLQSRFLIFGGWAFVFYTVFFVVANSLFVPQLVLTAAAGLLFGILPGIVVSMAGALASACLLYGLGSRWGPSLFSWFGADEETLFERYVQPLEASSIFHCRICGWVPFHPVNVACGMEGVSLAVFLLSSALGLLPRFSVYVLVGSSLDPDAWWLSAAVILWGGLILFQAGYACWFFHRRYHQRSASSSGSSPDSAV